ncbi:hypothetical protein BJ138DRAFT_1145327 [Hygrophoropsis aurantiaca]|uniref:Uncharacterized protein n=1 Tax=Hygrophoropsis aurantiaca TaxID=72124 RepID=A0ACB8AKL9_9AGAM|nr:hypothetical protein BJ138DRAFT_1145327 [Hygrophoropsis aurantiaca]
MLATFPAPVLSVTTDVVRDLEGREALSGLWTLFTKCKESLKDGRRLENISWRLWYRELSQTHCQPYQPLTPDSASSMLNDYSGRSPFFPPTSRPSVPLTEGPHPRPLSSGCYQQAPSPTSTASQIDDERASTSPLHSTTSAPFSSPGGRGKPSSFVGRIIVDMLPNNVLVSDKPGSSPAGPRLVTSQPPQYRPVPSVQLPSSPTSSEASFPRVVVVNPTPHPTPPTTPILHNDRPGAPQPPSTYLLPPLPPPALSTRLAPREPAAHIEPIAPSIPVRPADEPSAKPSDRRFFLQQSPEEASPERDGSTESGKSPSDLFEASSATSSHMKNITDTEERNEYSSKPRKGKEGGKHHVRPMTRRTHSSRHIAPVMQRKPSAQEGNKPRPTFNIGSGSSNGSKGANSSSTNGLPSKHILSHAPTPAPAPAPARETVAQPQPQPRLPSPPVTNGGYQRKKIVVASTSSEDYETTDADDSEWASEDMDKEDKVKEKQKQADEHRLREAALEAQRQRDLFAKVPKRSYSNLNRSQSGLLSQLMNPPPQVFPPNHPYRTTQSSHDFGQLPHNPPQRSSSGFAPPRLQTSKSAAVLPLAAQITAMNVGSKPPATNDNAKDSDKGVYRPKGRPKETEMEDDSDEEHDADDKIQVSQSVAQQKLQALISKRGSEPNVTSPHFLENPTTSLAPVATAPIPLGHPYNLPAPAAPMTPRATRRRMLRTELSESMRRQLLWERQVSSTTNPAGARRTSAGAPLGGLRPLTSTTSNGPHEARGTNNTQQPNSTRSAEAEDNDERKRRAMARNRSWADDYHYAGW